MEQQSRCAERYPADKTKGIGPSVCVGRQEAEFALRFTKREALQLDRKLRRRSSM